MLAGVAAGNAMAQTSFNYNPGDVFVCFRSASSVDLVVDAGNISTLTNLAPNAQYVISNFTVNQLNDVGLNGMSWSGFSWLSDDTLFITKPRTSLSIQTTPWQDKTGTAQGETITRMATIPPGAVDEENFSADSSSTAVVEEDNSGNTSTTYGFGTSSYRDAYLGAYGGQWGGTFQGGTENQTSGSFSTSGSVVRSDFYQMTPTSGYGLAKFLGYFELNASGVLTYVAYPTDTTPVITSISRAAGVSTINYTTGVYGNYTLKSSYSVTAPLSSWTSVASLSSGDTAVHSITDTDSNPAKYYIIVGK